MASSSSSLQNNNNNNIRRNSSNIGTQTTSHNAASSFPPGQITDPKFNEAMRQDRHLAAYIAKFIGAGFAVPSYYEKPDSNLKYLKQPNLIYPIGNHTYVHINSYSLNGDGFTDYEVVMPDAPNRELAMTLDRFFAVEAGAYPPPTEYSERVKKLDQFLSKVCKITQTPVKYDSLENMSKKFKKNAKKSVQISVYEPDFVNLKYHFLRRRAGVGLLEPFLMDSNLEDISVAGAGNVYLVHKIFGSLRAPISLTDDEIDELIISMSEQFGKTVTHSRPVIDTTLPDGSRINIIFGKDISRKGTNATIRKFAKVPLAITQIIASKTLDAREAAYMWMMLAEGMSVFICGETASGKTTTMTGISAFIPSTWKVVSIEDTQEITLPHPNWVNEITRDTGNAHSSVTMFDLLKAALRQRPNYILVGEIRGAEGNVAFQAMQTGHPVMSTFHAASVPSLIQRVTGTPINVPKSHVDNLNIALFQSAVQGKDGRMVRRVMSINEIVGYNAAADNVMFIPVFNWDPSTDSVIYRGKGSSSLFLSKLLVRRGMSRKDEGLLYEELELRTKILESMVKNKLFNYFDVYNRVAKIREVGLEAYVKTIGV